MIIYRLTSSQSRPSHAKIFDFQWKPAKNKNSNDKIAIAYSLNVCFIVNTSVRTKLLRSWEE